MSVKQKTPPVHLKDLCQSLTADSRPPTMQGSLKVLIIHEGQTPAPLPQHFMTSEDPWDTTVPHKRDKNHVLLQAYIGTAFN